MKRIVVIISILALVLMGAKAPSAYCYWTPDVVNAGEASILTAGNLPKEYAIIFQRYPVGVSEGPSPISVSHVRPVGVTEAIVITRGGGGALFKFGNQLNDYHPIALCYLTVNP